jgi:hypothetical protein
MRSTKVEESIMDERCNIASVNLKKLKFGVFLTLVVIIK